MFDMKRSLSIALIVALVGVFFACETMSVQTYPGNPRPAQEVASFYYPGTGFYNIVLYAVDRQPRNFKHKYGILESAYTDIGTCGFDAKVLPGVHAFELYTVNTTPLRLLQVKFKMDAGKTYTLKGNSVSFVIEENGKAVNADISNLPVYTEPAENQPHARLIFDRDKFDVNIYVFRLDGKVGNPMYKRHPRWVVMNNLDRDVELDWRLLPGSHTIEYTVEDGAAVHILKFSVEAGRRYKFKLVPDPERGSSGRQEPTVEVVPE